MFEAPKKLKFTRFHKIKLALNAAEFNLFCPKFGDYGLQALTVGKLNAEQLEAGRLVVRRFSKKQAFLKINVFPFLALTKKPTSARMGKGKGKISEWVVPVRRGRIIYEISSLDGHFRGVLPKLVFKLVNKKLPVRTRPVRLIY